MNPRLLASPPPKPDAAAVLESALDRLNALCWEKGDRDSLKAARAACARLRELERLQASFSEQLKDSLEKWEADRPIAAAFGVIWDRLISIPAEDQADIVEVIGQIASERDDPEEMDSIRRTVLEILEQEPIKVIPMDLGRAPEDRP